MLEGHGFSTKCFGTSLFNFRTDQSGHGPACKFWLLERALTLHIGCVPLRWSGSGSVIRGHSDHGRSNEPMNPLWKGFISSFDLLWSKWSRIADPDPDHPKGMHSLFQTLQSCFICKYVPNVRLRLFSCDRAVLKGSNP